MRKTNKSALHFINEVAGKSRLYIIFLLLVQMVLGISSVFYALLLRGLIDGAVAHDSKKMLTFGAARIKQHKNVFRKRRSFGYAVSPFCRSISKDAGSIPTRS